MPCMNFCAERDPLLRISFSFGAAHRFDQRPIAVAFTVLLAFVRPQKHSQMILSWRRSAFKTVGLHYIAVWESSVELVGFAPSGGVQNS